MQDCSICNHRIEVPDSLEEVHLKRGMFDRFPTATKSLPNLRKLLFYHSRCRIVNLEFLLAKLVVLDLSSNKIKKLSLSLPQSMKNTLPVVLLNDN